MRAVRIVLLVFLAVYLVPAALAALLWWTGDHPRSYRDANWSSAALLPAATSRAEAAVYIMAARTGGLKGSISEHSWIVIKRPGSPRYERWDKVGWGSPIRQDAFAADARWYSNEPRIVASATGPAAEALIPQVLAAIRSYPFAANGAYRIFPGPNSNSFVAHVLREVPGLGAVLPPAAVGRDYPVGGRFLFADADGRDVHASLFGYLGASVGLKSGLEVNVLGLVAGIDPFRMAVKIPAFGTYALTGG